MLKSPNNNRSFAAPFLALFLWILMMTSENAHALASSAASGASTTTTATAMSNNNNNHNKEIPQLLPSDPNKDKDIPTIQLGETIRFEEWGPIILNTDGTTRRIENWDTLTENEKKVTWRRISKRNEERRQKLLEQQQEQEQADNNKDDL